MIETMVPKSWYVEAIRERDHARAQAKQWTKEAFRLTERAGWSSFGTHVDQPGVELEFDGRDEAGMPLWERPKSQWEFYVGPFNLVYRIRGDESELYSRALCRWVKTVRPASLVRRQRGPEEDTPRRETT